MTLCMFIRDYKQSGGRTHYIYAWGDGGALDESPGYLAIEDLVKGLKKGIKPDFRGKLSVIWDAPPFLKDAVTQIALEAQHGGTPPTFTYCQINPEDRKKINDSMPEGIELTLE